MHKNERISVLLAASVTAIMFWISSSLVVPGLSIAFMSFAAAPARLSGFAARSDYGILFAMIIPICVAALGFVGGTFIAFIYNLVIADSLAPKATREDRSEEPVHPGRLFPVAALAQRLLEPQPVLAHSHAAGQ
jgi:hypothetical protein